MDVEGSEFDIIDSLTPDAAPRQLAFEAHVHNAYGQIGRPRSGREWMGLWSKLWRLGYGAYSTELNRYCSCCSEFSLMREL